MARAAEFRESARLPPSSSEVLVESFEPGLPLLEWMRSPAATPAAAKALALPLVAAFFQVYIGRSIPLSCLRTL